MEWYYAKDGKQEGPVSAAQLRQMASTGKLEPTDMVFKIGSKDWVEAATVSGLFAAGRSAPAAPPPEAGGFAFGGESEKVSTAPARRKGVRERDEDAPRPRSKRTDGGSMGDLMAFRRMIAPTVIMVLFWIGVVGAVLFGMYTIYSNLTSRAGVNISGAIGGLLSIPVSILLVRLYCELGIVIFRMNETLTDIKNALERQRNP